MTLNFGQLPKAKLGDQNGQRKQESLEAPPPWMIPLIDKGRPKKRIPEQPAVEIEEPPPDRKPERDDGGRKEEDERGVREIQVI